MKKRLIEIKWGLIFVIMMLVWMYFEKAMGWHDEKIADHATYTNFVAIPAILVYVFALIEKRKKHYHNVMSWKQGFVSGMIITAVVVILTPFSQMVTHDLISPEYFENVSAYAVNEGQMTQEEADNYFNLKNYLWQSAVFALIIGAVTSALVAVFVRRKV
jgi:Na+/proline symporter